MGVAVAIILVPLQRGLRTPQQVAAQTAAGKAALALCARRRGLPLDGWSKGPEGAPIASHGRFWSISHKPRYAMAAIAEHPVGVDIEQVTPRRSRLHEAIASPKEWDRLGTQDWATFYALWTAKEAVLKANGRGIGDLLKCEFTTLDSEGGGWLLLYGECPWRVAHRSFDGHILAVAMGAGLSVTIDWLTGEQREASEVVQNSGAGSMRPFRASRHRN